MRSTATGTLVAAILALSGCAKPPSWEGTRIGDRQVLVTARLPDLQPATGDAGPGVVKVTFDKPLVRMTRTSAGLREEYGFMDGELVLIIVHAASVQAADTLAARILERGPPSRAAAAPFGHSIQTWDSGGQIILTRTPDGATAVFTKGQGGHAASGWLLRAMVAACVGMSVMTLRNHRARCAAFLASVRVVDDLHKLKRLEGLAEDSSSGGRRLLVLLLVAAAGVAGGWYAGRLGLFDAFVFSVSTAVAFGVLGPSLQGFHRDVRAVPGLPAFEDRRAAAAARLR